MNSKYTPATYFGAFMFVVNLIIIQKQVPNGLNGSNIVWVLLGAAVGAVIGGFIFGLVWNWYKKRQTKG
jgi:hypothetical protein